MHPTIYLNTSYPASYNTSQHIIPRILQYISTHHTMHPTIHLSTSYHASYNTNSNSNLNILLVNQKRQALPTIQAKIENTHIHKKQQQQNDTKNERREGMKKYWFVSGVGARTLCIQKHMIHILLALFWMKPIDHTFTSLFPVRCKYYKHTNQQKTTLLVGHFRPSTKHNDPMVQCLFPNKLITELNMQTHKP